MRFIYTVFAALMLLSCNTNTAPGAKTAETAPAKQPARSKLSEEGTKLLLSVVGDYYTLKNAMVAGKAADATAAANQLAASTATLQARLQQDSMNMAALRPYTDTIITQSKLTAGINDPTCEKQRIAFGPVSSAMYGMLKAAELKNTKIYHQYCPMAFNEKGGYWLSAEEEIKNPYFGKKMMECGEVTDSLQ